MESEKDFLPKPEKPRVLYHASSNPNIEIFEPRADKIRDEKEGPRIFATPSRAMASMFLVPTDDSWTQSGTIDDIPYIVISDEERFKNLDRGGVIYSLPSDSFENDPQKGLRELEWTSAESVTPAGKETVSSALEDMIKQGVRVYFVNSEVWKSIQESDDNGEAIVNSLTPETL